MGSLKFSFSNRRDDASEGLCFAGCSDPRWHQEGGDSGGFTLIELLILDLGDTPLSHPLPPTKIRIPVKPSKK